MKSAVIKRLEGNPGCRPIPEEPDVSSKAPPKPPSTVKADKYALQEWKRLAGTLFKAGLLFEADAAAFGVYCCKYAAWRRASEEIEKLVKETGNEIYRTADIDKEGRICRSELVRIKQKMAMELLTAASEIGLTPKSRTKIGLMNQQKNKAASPLGEKRKIG